MLMGMEGKGRFGIRMLIRETRNHVPSPASLQISPWIWTSQPRCAVVPPL